MHKRGWILSAATAALAGCASVNAPPAASIAPRAETAPVAQSDTNAAILLPTRGGGLILGTSESGGVELYALDGARTGAIDAGAAIGVDARVAPGGDGWIVAVLDGAGNRLRLFDLNAETQSAHERTARALPIGFNGESLCLYRDRRDASLYAFALGGDGQIAQYLIAERGAQLDATLVRTLRLASEVSYCAADDVSGDLYVAEQSVGFWRFDADPEAEIVPQLIDAARLGNVTEEAGGVTFYRAGDVSYLIASDASANRFNLYDRNADHVYLGSFALSGVEAAGGLFASSYPFGDALPEGALLAADDENEGGTNYKLVSWADIAAAAGLASGAPIDPRVAPAPNIPIVRASLETPPMETDGDAADDPAIWVDRAHPTRSLIIATQKQSGLYVYDLQGRLLQFLPDGRMNNVDVRDGFRLGRRGVPIVTATNRSDDTLAIYRIDTATRRLVNVADGPQPTGFVDPYGLCMYQNPESGRTFVFVTDNDGPLRQWELHDAGNGRVRAERVRDIPFASQTEGCAADDATGMLYVAEEDVGLWRVGAEPDAPPTPVSVATVAENPALRDDLEGVAIYARANGGGYIVVSSQGNNTYALFQRDGDNAYVGSFAIVADAARGIDGVSETDGLDVSSANLGGAFADGLLVAQDGRNVAPQENQNFKFVAWSAIAAALNLE